MRDIGTDLFRCIMMLLIVLHHAIVHTQFNNCPALKPLFMLSNMGVVGFLVVSGWYGVRLTGRKVYSIGGQIIGYGLLFSLLSFPLANSNVIPKHVLSVGNAWYGVAYLALLCVSPILNSGIEVLHNQGNGRLALLVVFALLTVDWLSRVFGLGFSVSGFGSHTFGTFLCVYCIVRLIRFEFAANINSWTNLRSVAIGCCAVCVMALIRQDWISYNNPILVVLTTIIFLCFQGLDVGLRLQSVIRYIVPSLFAVYLIHDPHIAGKAIMIAIPFGWIYGQANRWILFPVMVVAVYFACILIDICVRRIPMKSIDRILERTRRTKANIR